MLKERTKERTKERKKERKKERTNERTNKRKKAIQRKKEIIRNSIKRLFYIFTKKYVIIFDPDSAALVEKIEHAIF